MKRDAVSPSIRSSLERIVTDSSHDILLQNLREENNNEKQWFVLGVTAAPNAAIRFV
jgi:hypothetical protein